MRPTSPGNSPLTAATPELLAEFIAGATNRLVVLAPAVPQDAAAAIEQRWRALGIERVTITLDVDPEVYRLGYGDAAALDRLEAVGRELGGMLKRHPGIRVGLIVADDRVLVYSPLPELIEAGPRRASSPNAVVFGAPAPELESALGVGERRHRDQTMGLDKATRAEIDNVREDLKTNPPQKFDVARRVRVFNAAFQFVELSLA